MKLRSHVPAFEKSAVLGFLLPVMTVLAATLVGSASAEPVPPEPKTHTLFMGADVLVEQNGALYRVQDVVGGSFVIKVDGREVKVPANWGAIKLKVNRALKLTGTTVSVEHLLVDRGYTPGNDPVKTFMHQQGDAMARQDQINDLVVQLEQAKIMQRIGGGSIIPGLTGDPATLERKLRQAEGRGLADYGNQVGLVGQMQDTVVKELFDAIEVNFDVSSDKVLAKPYVVVMAQFHQAESKPGEQLNWLYAAELDPLGSKPQKFRIKKGGFPPGFLLDGYQVHVYDGGQEVASTVADKRVPLTRNEAFAYLLLDYLGTHKGATLPATAVLGKLSPEAKARLSPDQLKHTYFVKVSKDGLPTAAYADAGFENRADDAVASLIGDVRFYPALENGKTIEGVAELRFSRLAL